MSYRARWLLVLPGESHASCEMREGGTREGRHEGGKARGRAGTRERRHEEGRGARKGEARGRERREEGQARGKGDASLSMSRPERAQGSRTAR